MGILIGHAWIIYGLNSKDLSFFFFETLSSKDLSKHKMFEPKEIYKL